jgi:hypothetical protein
VAPRALRREERVARQWRSGVNTRKGTSEVVRPNLRGGRWRSGFRENSYPMPEVAGIHCLALGAAVDTAGRQS